MENSDKKIVKIICGLLILAVLLVGICFAMIDKNGKLSSQKIKDGSKVETAIENETGKSAVETEKTKDEGETDEADGSSDTEASGGSEAYDFIADLTPGTIVEEAGIDRSNLSAYFRGYEISDEIFARINGQSYYENPDIGLNALRYMKVLHYNFNHQIQVGELIVNAELVTDYQEIFQQLFEIEYEIQSMYLIDNYWAGDGESSDTASIQENNTSAFCYRLITGGSGLSNHALGKAIDINPQQNPYVSYAYGDVYWYHENATEYVDRSAGLPHMIDHNDSCYQIFIDRGFTWGGDWEEPKDYQHFEHE